MVWTNECDRHPGNPVGKYPKHYIRDLQNINDHFKYLQYPPTLSLAGYTACGIACLPDIPYIFSSPVLIP